MSTRIIIALLIVSVSIACKQKGKAPQSVVESPVLFTKTDHPLFVDKLETAHKKEELFSHQSICINLDMTFGTNNSKFKIITTPNSSTIKVEKQDGTVTIVKDGDLYTNADASKWKNERFSIYTYHYFLMFPYKLSDPGTNWQNLSAMDISGKSTNRAMLTFDSGTGDAPDDWYIVHSDPTTNLISYVGYIVTGGGKSAEEAEKNAHAIGYSDYKLVDGIPIANTWKFFDYGRKEGLGARIGTGKVSNVMTLDILEDTYSTEGLTKI